MIPKQKPVKLDKQDKEIMDMIGEALEKKKDRRISDYFDGSQVGARNQIERLFNRAHYSSIDLSEQDHAFVSLVSFILTLTPS
jgi:hypothetical protein